MPAYRLVISPAAKADLGDIYQYGCGRWGEAQLASCVDGIKRQLVLLAQQARLGRKRPELIEGVRSLPYKSHTLYYRIVADRVELVRVLHGRQDPQRHL
ncbi:MAG: type II toxin-antitoxin system RelE/ParE family toxin [Cellvibrionaceae bacterium]|nr:type II toxin-antitoxin system RelE/ParE family toxin [Cellvibrionaceae bacterium]